jgi:predicted RNase H-like nuclease (RuvC/YqgF family)
VTESGESLERERQARFRAHETIAQQVETIASLRTAVKARDARVAELLRQVDGLTAEVAALKAEVRRMEKASR